MRISLLLLFYCFMTCCKILALPKLFYINLSGTVSGLTQGQTITITDTLTVNTPLTTGNGNFVIPYYSLKSFYNLKVTSVPNGFNCQITNSSGGPLTQNINNIQINCNETTQSIMVVGQNGNVVYSANDGVSWSLSETGSLFSINDVIFLNNVFYVVGDSGYFSSTENLTSSWKQTNLSINTSLNSLRYFNGTGDKYTIIGNNGLVQTSNDLNLWTTRTFSVPINLLEFTYCNNSYFAVGNYTNPVVEGVIVAGNNETQYDWSPVFSSTTSQVFNSILCYNNQSQTNVMVVGNAGVLLKSTDNGVTWTNSVINANFNFKQIITGLNNSIVAIGSSLDNTTGAVFLSTDAGVTWNQQTPVAITLNPLTSIALSSAGTYVAVGGTSIYTSTDLLNWVTPYNGTTTLNKVRTLS